MKISQNLQSVINTAYLDAKERNHEYLTPEHILYAALYFDEFIQICDHCDADVDEIKSTLESFFESKVPVVKDLEPQQSIGFQDVLSTLVKLSYLVNEIERSPFVEYYLIKKELAEHYEEKFIRQHD